MSHIPTVDMGGKYDVTAAYMSDYIRHSLAGERVPFPKGAHADATRLFKLATMPASQGNPTQTICASMFVNDIIVRSQERTRSDFGERKLEDEIKAFAFATEQLPTVDPSDEICRRLLAFYDTLAEESSRWASSRRLAGTPSPYTHLLG